MVTANDTIRWLHDDGLARLAGFTGRLAHPVAAYTIDIGTGTISAHPATGVGLGSDVMTVAADDLPEPVGTPRRLVVVGVTSTDAILVLDLATTITIAINADQPERPARAWAMQLLFNPDVTLTTNGADMAIGESARFRKAFIPGGSGTVVNVDDRRPPVTQIQFNPSTDGPDHLDVTPDGAGEVYLGARFWRLRQVMSIDDAAWTALSESLAAPDEAQAQPDPAPDPGIEPGPVQPAAPQGISPPTVSAPPRIPTTAPDYQRETIR